MHSACCGRRLLLLRPQRGPTRLGLAWLIHASCVCGQVCWDKAEEAETGQARLPAARAQHERAALTKAQLQELGQGTRVVLLERYTLREPCVHPTHPAYEQPA